MPPPKSTKTPQRIAPGGDTHRFNRQNFMNPERELMRSAQLRDLEARQNQIESLENEENTNRAIEQAQNENYSREMQDAAIRQNLASQQEQQKNQLLRTSLQQKANLIKQMAKQRAMQAVTKEVAKKAGGHVLSYIGIGGCGGLLTAFIYLSLLLSAVVIIMKLGNYLGLVSV